MSQAVVLETQASIHAQRWEWDAAIEVSAQSAEVWRWKGKTAYAQLATSRLEWLAGYEHASIVRAQSVVRSQSADRRELGVTVALPAAMSVARRIEATRTTAEALDAWWGVISAVPHPVPGSVAVNAALAIARLTALEHDEATARAILTPDHEWASPATRAKLAQLNATLKEPLHLVEGIDPAARVHQYVASSEARPEGASRRTYERAFLWMSDLNCHGPAADYLGQALARPVVHRPGGPILDRVFGRDPVELMVWSASRTDPRIAEFAVMGAAAKAVDLLIASNRPKRASQLLDRIAEHKLMDPTQVEALRAPTQTRNVSR